MSKSQSTILADLIEASVVEEARLEVFAEKTRDIDPLYVYKDPISGVILIPNYYGGTSQYESGDYRLNKEFAIGKGWKREVDSKRYLRDFSQYYLGKSVVDFGCGHGDFLLNIRDVAESVIGIEIEEGLVRKIRELGIRVEASLDMIDPCSVDSIFLFHNFEHMPNPLLLLKEILRILKPGGLIVMELPHANDFLIRDLKCDKAIEFMLWSQHLVLHTRISIKGLLEYVGFESIITKGIQRYGLANHLKWLQTGKPGGHLDILSIFESEELRNAYSNALASIDATDSLYVVGQKPKTSNK